MTPCLGAANDEGACGGASCNVLERLLNEGRSGGELDILLIVRLETPDCPTGVLGRSPFNRDGGRSVEVRLISFFGSPCAKPVSRML